MTEYKKFFDQKELQIKMSSVMPFFFNAVELCVVIINGKPLTCAREVCKALEYNKKQLMSGLKIMPRSIK